MTITWDNSGQAYEKGPCSRTNCEINPCSGHCKVRRPEHDRPPPVAWIATRLWNDRETWTGPADIAAVLAAPAPAAPAPLARPLTDEQILARGPAGITKHSYLRGWRDCEATGQDAAAPAPVAQPRGYLLHWPAMGGGRQLVWSERDSAGVAIGCPVEPVYSFGVREAMPQEGGAA